LYLSVNNKRIDAPTLREIIVAGGSVKASGKCGDKGEISNVMDTFSGLKPGDNVEFEAEDNRGHSLKGTAQVRKVNVLDLNLGSSVVVEFSVFLHVTE
jgi:plastocyanin